MNLIPVLWHGSLLFIVRKNNDNRTTCQVVSEYKEKLKQSEQKQKEQNKKMKLVVHY